MAPFCIKHFQFSRKLNRRLMGTFLLLGALGAELNARPLLMQALGLDSTGRPKPGKLTQVNGAQGDIA